MTDDNAPAKFIRLLRPPVTIDRRTERVMLLVGAAAGSVLAQLAVHVLPMAWVGDPRVMAVVGMAAVLAAVTHAPLMAIVMVMEMTNQFQLTLPTMLACGVAHAVSTRFGAKPLYGNPIEARS